MQRMPVRAAAAAAVVLLVAAPAASAVEYPPPPPPPPPPVDVTSVEGICVGDVPYYQYRVDFGENGKYVGQPMKITFVNPNGGNFVIDTTVPPPGQAQQNIWPGASENPQDWPGWVLDADGQWVESTTDPGAFTRAAGGVTVQFSVNPTLETTASYPPASSICANPKNVKPVKSVTPGGEGGGGGAAGGGAAGGAAAVPTGGGNTTPTTGANLLPAVGGAAALAAGGGLFLAARRRRNG